MMKKTLFLLFIIIALAQHSYTQISGSLIVNGDSDKYYPVTFYDGGWQNNIPTTLILGRSSVHIDSDWRGSLMANFRYHTTIWGNGSNFIEADIAGSPSPNAQINAFIAGWHDATGNNGSYSIIIWLRGGGTTYFTQSNYAVNPVVYDGVQNSLPYNESNGPSHSYKTTPDSYVTLKGVVNATKINVNGDHVNTNMLLHSIGGGTNETEADLMLWASEPSVTYTGVGIGNNVKNWDAATSTGGISRIHNSRGGSYIRLLDNKINFNLVSNSGTDQSVLTLNGNGNVGIGTSDPTNSLTIRKSPESDYSHLFFGEPFSTAGEASARLCFAGTGIQHATFVWIPNTTGDNGKLNLSFGGSDNGVNNPTKVTFQSNGNVGIGTVNPGYKLDVIGTIRAREIKVNLDGADFVFEDGYKLMPLNELERFVRQNKHLPEITPAKEMQENGSDLGSLSVQLLQKIEELTLHMIEQNKEMELLKEQIKKLEQQK